MVWLAAMYRLCYSALVSVVSIMVDSAKSTYHLQGQALVSVSAYSDWYQIFTSAVIEAARLTVERSTTFPDAFVKVRVNDFIRRTKVVKKTVNPVWNEGFQLCAFDLLICSNVCIPMTLCIQCHAPFGSAISTCQTQGSAAANLGCG